VACDNIDVYSWKDADKEVFGVGNPNKLQVAPAVGFAGKAMDVNRATEDPRARVIWVVGRDEAYFQERNGSQMHCIAHELGHALGNITHTIEKYDVGPPAPTDPGGNGPWSGHSYLSDNNKRLMTGMSGPKRKSGPKLLNKLERDKISIFKNYKNLD